MSLVRKGRLTASNFGAVLLSKRVTPSLKKRLMGEYDLSGVKAIMWGVHNESEAVKFFTTVTGLAVIPTGIWLDESGILGASPDGLVDSDYVLEVKCPYSFKDSTISDASENKLFCLRKCTDDSYELRPDHVYWHQVQGQMYLTNRSHCYFVVWTLKDAKIITIKLDLNYATRIQELRDFYYTHMLPCIIGV